MKKLNYILITLSVCLYACNQDDGFGEEEVKVTINYLNESNGNSITEVLANKTVFLKEKGADNFLYTSTTDKNGIAEFKLLESGDFEVTIEDSINGLPFIGQGEFNSEKVSDLTVTLAIDNEQVNGFSLSFVDNRGEVVPNVDFCVFRNEELADSNNCSFSNYSGTVNELGEFRKLNIPADLYYLNITDTIAGRPVQLLKYEFEVELKGIAKRNVVLF